MSVLSLLTDDELAAICLEYPYQLLEVQSDPQTILKCGGAVKLKPLSTVCILNYVFVNIFIYCIIMVNQ